MRAQNQTQRWTQHNSRAVLIAAVLLWATPGLAQEDEIIAGGRLRKVQTVLSFRRTWCEGGSGNSSITWSPFRKNSERSWNPHEHVITVPIAVPENIALCPLPLYSPQLNPGELLWE